MPLIGRGVKGLKNPRFLVWEHQAVFFQLVYSPFADLYRWG